MVPGWEESNNSSPKLLNHTLPPAISPHRCCLLFSTCELPLLQRVIRGIKSTWGMEHIPSCWSHVMCWHASWLPQHTRAHWLAQFWGSHHESILRFPQMWWVHHTGRPIISTNVACHTSCIQFMPSITSPSYHFHCPFIKKWTLLERRGYHHFQHPRACTCPVKSSQKPLQSHPVPPWVPLFVQTMACNVMGFFHPLGQIRLTLAGLMPRNSQATAFVVELPPSCSVVQWLQSSTAGQMVQQFL